MSDQGYVNSAIRVLIKKGVDISVCVFCKGNIRNPSIVKNFKELGAVILSSVKNDPDLGFYHKTCWFIMFEKKKQLTNGNILCGCGIDFKTSLDFINHARDDCLYFGELRAKDPTTQPSKDNYNAFYQEPNRPKRTCSHCGTSYVGVRFGVNLVQFTKVGNRHVRYRGHCSLVDKKHKQTFLN